MRWLYGFLAIAGIFTLSIKSTLAQSNIVPDNTLGTEASNITPNVLVNGRNADLINGGAIRDRNLFHSFSEFNIKDGQRVYFSSPSGIINILTRVTGGNASSILGTLGVNGAANLFLINPNGIVFGKNAQLDVQGSFIGTTANGVQLGNQGFFSATNPQAPALLTVNPSALFFNQINQNAAIENNSVAPGGKNLSEDDTFGLRIPNGKSLLLVGGNVTMNGGRLNAFDGRVELGGLTETGTVGLEMDGNNFKLNFPENVTRGDISLSDKAGVYVQGASGGNVSVYARNIDLSENSIIFAGIGKNLDEFEDPAGDIILNATGDIKFTDLNSKIDINVRPGSKGNSGNVNVTAKGNIVFLGGIASRVQTGGTGNGGDITIKSGSLKLQDGAFITTSVSGEGNAGNIDVDAEGEISLSRSNILTQVEAGGIGNAGNIDINAAKLSLANGGQILTSIKGESNNGLPAAKGDAGNILVKITGGIDIVGKKVDADGNDAYSGISSRVNQGVEGNGGNITVNSDNLNLQEGTFVIASTAGEGNAGNVDVMAKDEITLVGGSILSQVEAGGTGNGGNITINSDDLNLQEGTLVITSTAGEGNAGNINVIAKGEISLSRSNILSQVEAGGIGNADEGNIKINAAKLSLAEGGQILTSIKGESNNGLPAAKGDAGNILVKITGGVDIVGKKVDADGNDAYSGISSRVNQDAEGNGGDITINSGYLNLQDGTFVTASTQGKGNAGTININADEFLTISGKTSNSTSGLYVDSASQTGITGDIIVNSPKITIDNQGTINAESRSVNGGNIKLKSGLILLRRGVQITTNAGTAQAGGDGGNITINAPNGFVVALPDENSDITANAFSGRGGSVTINATSIFGLVSRSRNELERLLGTTNPEELNPKELPTSDITAISQTSADLDGEVNLDVTSSFITREKPLPEKLQVSEFYAYCQPQRAENLKVLEFVYTRRGGKPSSPYELLGNNQGWRDLRSESNLSTNNNLEVRKTNNSRKVEIIEAQGIYINPQGEIYLARNPSTITPYKPWLLPSKCGKSKAKVQGNN